MITLRLLRFIYEHWIWYNYSIHIYLTHIISIFPIDNSCKKVFWKICSQFTEHPCRNVILIELQSNFIVITFLYGCSPADLLHVFRTTFYKNNFREMLLFTHLDKPLQILFTKVCFINLEKLSRLAGIFLKYVKLLD